MSDKNKEYMNELLSKFVSLNYIKPNEVPNINLYMDQVTTFMEEHLSDAKRREDDKILTKTMINNYAKNNLLPPPVKKKYSKEHLYILTFIYYLKNLLTISDIQKILNPLTDKFFEGSKKPDLDEIYREIYIMEKAHLSVICQDVSNKADISKDMFSDVEDTEEREFLQMFSMVCLLSFDIFIKKNIIESIIDDYTDSHSKTFGTDKKTDKKNEKAEKRAEKKSEKASKQTK